MIKKNRIEKGIREELIGSNPHSKGDVFSRSLRDFFDNKEAIIMTSKEIRLSIMALAVIMKIIYTN